MRLRMLWFRIFRDCMVIFGRFDEASLDISRLKVAFFGRNILDVSLSDISNVLKYGVFWRLCAFVVAFWTFQALDGSAFDAFIIPKRSYDTAS